MIPDPRAPEDRERYERALDKLRHREFWRAVEQKKAAEPERVRSGWSRVNRLVRAYQKRRASR